MTIKNQKKVQHEYENYIVEMKSPKYINKNDFKFGKDPESTTYSKSRNENKALVLTIKYLCAEYLNMVNKQRIGKSSSNRCKLCDQPNY